MYLYNYTKGELEEQADFIKTVILGALVNEKFMIFEDAEEWAMNHSIIINRKGFFQTLSDKWIKKEDKGSHYYIVVKRVLKKE